MSNKTISYDEIDVSSDSVFIEGDLLEKETEVEVYKALETIIRNHFSLGQDAGLTRERHGDCVRRAKASIEMAAFHLGIAPELAGDDLRSALRALSELAGETDIEAVFDRIFSRFCVGK